MRKLFLLLGGVLLGLGCNGNPQIVQNPLESAEDALQRAESAFEAGDIEKAALVLEQAAQADPDNLEVVFAAGSLLYEMGLEEKDPSASNSYFHRSASYIRKLIATSPDLDSAAQELVQEVLLSEARALTREDKLDEAFTTLGEAIDAGFDNRMMIQVDVDFAAIRKRPDFTILVDRIAEKSRGNHRQEARRLLDAYESFDFSFELPDPSGSTIASADYRGKVMIVDFWGTWCAPCLQELPHFIELDRRYRDQGLEIVGINYENAPAEEISKTIQASIKANKITYHCVVGDEATRDRVPDFGGFPTTLFIDRGGQVRLVQTGYHPYERLEGIVLELLSESQAPGS